MRHIFGGKRLRRSSLVFPFRFAYRFVRVSDFKFVLMRAVFKDKPIYEDGDYLLFAGNRFIRRSAFYQNEKPLLAIRIRTIQPLQRRFFRLDGGKRYDRKERALYHFFIDITLGDRFFDGWHYTSCYKEKQNLN